MDPRIYARLHEIEATHWWFRGRREILAAALRRLGAWPTRILDLGCGAGTNLDLIGALHPGSTVLGIDLHMEPLRYCRGDRADPLVQADAASLPLASASFDLVMALDTLEHVPDDATVLAELRRVCRPGGMLLLTVPAFPFLWGNIDEAGRHYRRYRRRELVARVERAGFTPRLVRYFNYLLFPPIAAVRLASRLVPERRGGAPEEMRTDFDLVASGPLNSLLARVLSVEASLLALDPPFGVSLLCGAVREPGARA
jgi:SAM-dependent methyltransferase